MSARSAVTRFELNSKIAAGNRAAFALDGVTVVSLSGPPGSGKTSIIEAMARHLRGRIHLAAIIGNPTANAEAQRLARLNIRTVAIQTDTLCAFDVRNVLADLYLPRTDMLLIESDWRIENPGELDLGQDRLVTVLTAADRDDAPVRYAPLICESDLVLLSKVDLLPRNGFNPEVFEQNLRLTNSGVELMKISCESNVGIDTLLQWVAARWSPDKRFRAYTPTPQSGGGFKTPSRF
jgi:hydrogenase nickel incorporation protein HypB